ncbi:MAG: M50 family metallopeptidase [Eubacterium sp.]|nr:M50 family metallopeptidase [Eubacterium sp.]
MYILLFSVLHESGHIFSLLLFKERPDEIRLSFYGASLKYGGVLSPVKEAMFLLSGIAINLIFALADIKRCINLSLLFVNALPIIPLDGGRALSLILKYKTMRIISALTLCILFVTALALKNLSLVLISVYVAVYSYYEG